MAWLPPKAQQGSSGLAEFGHGQKIRFEDSAERYFSIMPFELARRSVRQ